MGNMDQNSKHTVLVVEDDRSLASAISKKLELSDFGVISVNSVDDALKAMKDRVQIGAVWLDHYLLGEKDGIDLVSTVKADDNWKTIPIYIVSNTASDDKVQSYFKLGITKYFVKSDHRLDEIIGEIRQSVSSN
jgi:DNA-binding NtrC family response regulator